MKGKRSNIIDNICIWKERDWEARKINGKRGIIQEEIELKRKRLGGEKDERKEIDRWETDRTKRRMKTKKGRGKIYEKKVRGRRERWRDRDEIDRK